MALKFFVVPVHFAQAFESEINSFLASHRILSVDRRLIDCGENSYWAICLDFHSKTNETVPVSGKKGRVDYRELLPPEQFSLFVRLRDLRSALAAKESVPVYTIFTNDQLAAMVRQGVQDRAGLASISGVGEARTTKYGEAFLEILQTRSAEVADAASEQIV